MNEKEKPGTFERNLSKMGSFLDSYWPPLLTALGSVGMAFIVDLTKFLRDGYASQPWYWTGAGVLLALATIGAVVIGAIGTTKATKDNVRLRARNEKLTEALSKVGTDINDAWRIHLQGCVQPLEFDGSDRISIYKFDQKKFYMIGRYSETPEFAKKGRGVYPADQGCIGASWRAGDGWSFTCDLPDPKFNAKDYAKIQKKDWSIPDDVCRDLKMKPRTIAAFALKDSGNMERAAVLVIESEKPDRFNPEKLQEYLKGNVARTISLLLDVLDPESPSLSYAREEGY